MVYDVLDGDTVPTLVSYDARSRIMTKLPVDQPDFEFLQADSHLGHLLCQLDA